jgi:hypothetical protein
MHNYHKTIQCTNRLNLNVTQLSYVTFKSTVFPECLIISNINDIIHMIFDLLIIKYFILTR